MRFFVFRVRQNVPTRLQPVGYASCWINKLDRDAACLRAQRVIENEGWSIEELDSEKEVDHGTYVHNKEGKEFFEQALLDDEVVAFFVVRDPK